MNFFIQPKKYESLQPDEGSRAIMQKTIDFFEHMAEMVSCLGKVRDGTNAM